MRVGIDAKYLLGSRRGVGQYIFYLVKHLVAIEENEYVLFYNHCRSVPEDRKPKFLQPNATEKCFRLPTGVLEFMWRRYRFPRIERLIGPIDVFHEPVLHVIPPARAATVVTLYDFVALRYPENFEDWYIASYRHGLRMIEERADRVIVISEATRADVLHFTRIPEGRICVVPLGVDPVFCPIKDEEQLSRVLAEMKLERGYVLYVGGADPHKNLHRLLDAYSMLPADVQEDHPIVFAGSLSEDYRVLMQRAAALGLEKRTMCLGYVPDEYLPWLYNGAVLVATPSLCEGFGLVGLEGMACGAPVVASRGSSFPEVAGEACVLVDPLDVEQMSHAIRQVLTDPAMRADLREKGLRRSKELTWENAAIATLDVYADAIASRR